MTPSEEEVRKIDQSAAEAVHVIARAAEEASKVLATATSEAKRITDVTRNADHDLLIKLTTQMDGLRIDVKELGNNAFKKLGEHEIKIEKHELAIQVLKTQLRTWGIALVSVLGLLEFVLNYLK